MSQVGVPTSPHIAGSPTSEIRTASGRVAAASDGVSETARGVLDGAAFVVTRDDELRRTVAQAANDLLGADRQKVVFSAA